MSPSDERQVKGMGAYELARISNFAGGLNLKESPVLLNDNQATEILNFEFDVAGALVKRNGFEAFNGTPIADATGMDNAIRFARPESETRTLLAAVNRADHNKVYKGNDATGTFTEVTGGSALDANLHTDMAVYRDYVFLSNGAQTMQCYQSGATKGDCAFSDNNRKGKYLAVCDDRLFVAGDASAPNTLYFSEIGLFATSPGMDCSFPANNFIVVPKRDTGDEITGLAVYGAELFIFRRNDFWALMGTCPEDYIMQEVNNRVGAVGHAAVANTGDGLVFVGAHGIYEYRDGATADIGANIAPLLRSEDFSNARAAYYPRKRQVWISFRRAGAANDSTLVFDTLLRAWTVFDFGGNCFCTCDGAGDSGDLYRGDPSAGTVYRMDTGSTDAGAAIETRFGTKHFVFGAVETPKAFRRLFFEVNSPVETGCADVEVSVDFGRQYERLTELRARGLNRWGEFEYGGATYGGGQMQTIAAPLRTGMTGRTLQLTLGKTDAHPITLYGVGVQYRMRTLRGE